LEVSFLLDDDNKRPFKNFTKNVEMKGYSQEGKFFIKNMCNFSEGIPYTYYFDAFFFYELLSFDFAGRDEKLIKVTNYQ
jgi:uncharacterized radical SAM superfamily Fe-S cluster-containing enzyme